MYVNIGIVWWFVGTIIPSVCVVLEGGPGTLKTVKSAIEGGTPAVIVEVDIRLSTMIIHLYTSIRRQILYGSKKRVVIDYMLVTQGSGRAADIIAYAYAHSREEKVEVTDKLARKVLK